MSVADDTRNELAATVERLWRQRPHAAAVNLTATTGPAMAVALSNMEDGNLQIGDIHDTTVIFTPVGLVIERTISGVDLFPPGAGLTSHVRIVVTRRGLLDNEPSHWRLAGQGILKFTGWNWTPATRDRSQMTQDRSADSVSPVWSPDGQRIAFVANGRSGDIYFMKADGANARLLARSEQSFASSPG